jgi:hypothetical protein
MLSPSSLRLVGTLPRGWNRGCFLLLPPEPLAPVPPPRTLRDALPARCASPSLLPARCALPGVWRVCVCGASRVRRRFVGVVTVVRARSAAHVRRAARNTACGGTAGALSHSATCCLLGLGAQLVGAARHLG